MVWGMDLPTPLPRDGMIWHNMPDYFKTISLSLREMCTQVFVCKRVGVWNVLQNTPGKKNVGRQGVE